MTLDSPFIARITHWEDCPTPVRAYVFREGLDEGFEGKVDLAHSALLEATAQVPAGIFDYMLAAIWFNPKTQAKTIDFFGYSGLEKDWKANPEINPFIVSKGLFVPRTETTIDCISPGKNSFCGTTMVMLGREEDYRLTTRDIREYFAISPHLEGLEPPVDL